MNTHTLYIIFLLCSIVFLGWLLISLLRIPKEHLAHPDYKVREGNPYPLPYQPPTKKTKVVKKVDELPLIKIGDWVYDPNISYRYPRGPYPKQGKS